MNNENKRGFAGLSQLTSEISIQSEISCSAHQITVVPFASQEKKVFDLINILDWPTLPAPWSSVDSGETWVWDDFILTFQKQPETVFDVALEKDGGTSRFKGMMNYHYAMSVYYRYDRSPHKDKLRPIMIVALEQSDKGMLKQLINDKERLQPTGELGSIVLGVFFGKTHYNYGDYTGEFTPEDIKNHFFSVIASKLGLSGKPKYVGNLSSAHGNSETGMPSRNNEFTESFVGIKQFLIFILMIGITVFVVIIFMQWNKNSVITSNNSLKENTPRVNTSPVKAYQGESRMNNQQKISNDEFEFMTGIRLNQTPAPTLQGAPQTPSMSDDEFESMMGFRPDRSIQVPHVAATSNTINNYPSFESTREAQILLTELGYSPGPIDGKIGRQTTLAVKNFQKNEGLSQNGVLDQSLLDALKKKKVNKESTVLKTTSYAVAPSVPVSQPLPRSGDVRMFTKKVCIAPLEIKASQGSHYLVKLVNIYSASESLTVFVRSGSNIDIEVPLGTYEVRYASGETWYGYEKLFGSDTSYSKADETFTFERIGNQIAGFTITLYKVVNGNLHTSTINAASF